ncbi:hypothetical protein ACFXJ8_43110 [Nonomuraea sp. NPDC059194]|uniref:hypothetical protein n=1 Tax=Nonomuraea sp. NPDC059194 TaxID=3346764 RepID=UPI0036878672
MVNTRPDQLAYQERLLTALRDELRARTIPAVLVITEDGRPGLDVVDSRFRTRRVFVHLAFCWFYWGDQQDERVTCLRLLAAVEHLAEVVANGWNEGEQGEIGVDLSKIANTHRS